MKRAIWMLVLLLALLTPAALGEGNRLLELGEDDYLEQMLSDGGTLYISADSGLYTWRVGDEEPTAWEYEIDSEENSEASEDTIYLWQLRLYTDGGGLRGVCVASSEDGEPESLKLADIILTDRGTMEARQTEEIPLPPEIRDDGYWYLSAACAHGGVLTLMGEGESEATLLTLDPANPKDAEIQTLGWEYHELIPAGDEALLADHTYEDRQEKLSLYRVGRDGAIEPLCELPGANGIASDSQSGATYATVNGRVCPVDLQTGELGEAVASLPLAPGNGALLDGGRWYAASMDDRVAVLDTTSLLDEDSLLTVYAQVSDDWLRKAMINYDVEHPEISPVRVYNYRTQEQILEAMLTQTAEPDVFMLDMGESECQALLDRGFALPLADSEALKALCERMYPGIERAVTRDGVPVALPLQASSYGMGIDLTALERMGLSGEDVPEDWMGFLDFLEEKIGPAMERLGSDTHFTYDGMSAEGFRFSLMGHILRSYVYASAAAGAIADYSDPYLADLLERLDGMDFTEFGLPEAEDGDMDYGYSWDGNTSYLIQLDMDYGLDEYSTGTPLTLGFGDDLPGVLALDIQVAVVNPFSAHAAEAEAFLDALAERLPDTTLYMLCPDLNEPVRRPEADRNIREYDEQIARLQAELERAEPADRQEMEENLGIWQKDYESYVERESWLISPKKLEQYRALGDRATVTVPSWFEQDSSGEAWELMEQYLARKLTAREFLNAVSQKARMMALEG